MKKTVSITVVIMLAFVLALPLAAQTDSEEEANQELVGQWEYVTDARTIWVYEFTSDGVMNIRKGSSGTMSGTYRVEGCIVIMSFQGMPDSDNEFVTEDNTLILKRLADNFVSTMTRK